MSADVSYVVSRLRAEASHIRNLSCMKQLVEMAAELEAMPETVTREELFTWMDGRSRGFMSDSMDGKAYGNRASLVLDTVAEELLKTPEPR